MVFLKQESYGVNGYQLPVTPRGARSSRKRCSFKNRVEDNRMCAFDLLASVARKLLHENGSISTSPKRSSDTNCNVSVKASLKRERRDECRPLKVETCHPGSCKRQVDDSELSSQAINRNDGVPQPPSSGNGSGSDCSGGIDDQMPVGGEVKNEVGSFLCKAEGCPSVSSGSVYSNESEDENKGPGNEDEDMGHKILMVEQVNLCHREEPIVWDETSHAQTSPLSSAKAATCGDRSPYRCVSTSQFDDVNVVSKDVDEIFLGYTCPSTTKKSFRPGPRIGDGRIRKILASKYWKAPPKLNKVSLSSSDEAFKPSYCERNIGLKCLRSERNFPIKKRKSFHYSSVSSSDGGIISDGTSYSPEKDINEDSASYLNLHRASGATSSVAEKVKLRIKSFKVPELFVEIPETATVGSLKSTVVEALSTILGGGLGVGILLQGKKIKDDNKTLLQTGISRGNQLDSLGFSLEPNSFRTSQCSHPAQSSLMLPHEAPQPLNRILGNPSVIHGKAYVASEEQQVPDLIYFNERVHETAFTTDVSSHKHATDSKALVAVPAMSFEALAVVPAHRKPKQAELAQRRIRRPFSVAEVEALVQAVEKIGTGRWRDVKLRAFDDAKHRTYVDLKDKWKTLVHTARISPQQRRGEPVPQELLDRVLRAQAYWSEKQAKQQLKQQLETRLVL